MNTNILVTFLSLTLPALPAAAGPKAPVERVVVFADRAEVTRSLAATCREGKAEAIFEMLPANLDDRTLRAEASGGAKAVGTTSRLVPLEQDRDERVAAMKKELLKLQDEMGELQDAASGHRERLNVLAAFGSHFQALLREEVRNPKPDPHRWEKVLDQMKSERLEVDRKQSELNVKLRKLSRQVERLERRLENLQPQAVAEARTVAVAVECGNENNPKVSLSYVIPGATWHPEYDLRFLPPSGQKVGKGRVELTVAAVVQQATGEDWSDVQLLLSTAKPKLGAEAPYPARLNINGYEVGKERIMVTTMEQRESLQGPAGATTPGGPAEVGLEDKGQSILLVLPRRTTVMADGRPYWMPVDVVSGEGEGKLATVPKMMPYVYQVVAMKNPAAYPLLAGRIHSYRSGSYVGDTQLAYKAAGEPMEVSLGFDEELKVERKDLLEKDRRPGFLSGTKHLERAYRTKLVNRASATQSVEVRENIPVSKTEEIEVELQKDKTSKGYVLDDKRGFITWKLDLARGEEKSVDLAFTVHLPKNWEVQGQ